jgi:hypothetical protein
LEWQSLKGIKRLEADVLAFIDVSDRMAYHIEATQAQPVSINPAAVKEQPGILEQYAAMITSHKAMLQPYSAIEW